MRKLDKIYRQITLPEALGYWEQSWNKGAIIAHIFRFWRVRYFFILLLTGGFILFDCIVITVLWILLCCTLDYFIKRSIANAHFQNQLKILKKIFVNDFYKWDKERKSVKSLDVGKKKIIKYSPVHMMRRKWVKDIAFRYFKKSFVVLDAGCRSGEVSQSIKNTGALIVGLDLNNSDLKNFKNNLESCAVQGSILDLPFEKERFDAVLCLEVVEHLYDPLRGLHEIAKVIKPGGLLLLSTDNRNKIGLSDLINPLIILEKLIGLVFPKVLGPRNILWGNGKMPTYYHASFAKYEIDFMIKNIEFEFINYISYFYLEGLHEIVGKLKQGWTQNDYLRFMFPLEKFFVKFPIIRALGNHWLLVLRKPI